MIVGIHKVRLAQMKNHTLGRDWSIDNCLKLSQALQPNGTQNLMLWYRPYIFASHNFS